jgi:tetratricopeptide (TPR) repeat protein
VSDSKAKLGAYTTAPRANALVRLSHKDKVIWYRRSDLGPNTPVTAEVRLPKGAQVRDLELSVHSSEHEQLVYYRPEPEQAEAIPNPAQAISAPAQLQSTEALFLAGLHLEQYRHATREPENYYREALRRDPKDLRNNNALGLLLVRRGQFEKAESFFKKAIETQTRHNPNPFNGESYYNLGVCLRYLKRNGAAYDAFFKATWNAAWQDPGFFQLAQIAAMRGDFRLALEHVDSSLARNSHNQKATHLRTLLLRNLGLSEQALTQASHALHFDPLDFGSRNELILLGQQQEKATLAELMGGNAQSYLAIAEDYANAGAFQEAITLLESFVSSYAAENKFAADSNAGRSKPRAPGHIGQAGMPNALPMVFYFLGYYSSLNGDEKLAQQYFTQAKAQPPGRCFPNSLQSILALQAALQANPRDGRASFYLGNLWYDKRQVSDATDCWEKARQLDPSLPTVHRNLALVYFNKQNNPQKALKAMERAFALDQTDARILFELDLLKKRAGTPPGKRLAFLLKHRDLVNEREDLLVEFVALLNFFGHHEQALEILMSHKFHPWEGGEGKVTGQYVISLVEIAKELLEVTEPLSVVDRSSPGSAPQAVFGGEPLQTPNDAQSRVRRAIDLLVRARLYPENLGEGKLHGAQENQILYWLGAAYSQAGDTDSARQCWKEASAGMKVPTPAVYYNDQNPESIFYQGLALQELKKPTAAAQRFRTLVNFAREHLNNQIQIDYFAVSLPEFMVFDDDLNRRNEINCHHLLALGLLGLGKEARALTEFKKVLQLDPAHLSARLHLRHRTNRSDPGRISQPIRKKREEL